MDSAFFRPQDCLCLAWKLACVCCMFLTLALLSGCFGYTASGDRQTFSLPAENRNLYIQNVFNPTMDSSLDLRLRSILRDELNLRGVAVWASPGQATGFVQLSLDSISTGQSLTGSTDQTLQSTVTVSLSAEIKDEAGASLGFGHGTASEIYYGTDSKMAEDLALKRAVRMAVDNLSHNF